MADKEARDRAIRQASEMVHNGPVWVRRAPQTGLTRGRIGQLAQGREQTKGKR